MKILSGRKPSATAVVVTGIPNCEATGESTSSTINLQQEVVAESTHSPIPVHEVKDKWQLKAKVKTETLKQQRSTMNSDAIYHEKQVRAMCALHTLNNLFQDSVFNKEQLDNICYNLSPNTWVNPHKNMIGLGDYDINVIMTALEQKGYELVWYDKRKDPSTIDLLTVFGFILNVPTDTKLGWLSLPLKRKHWFSVKEIGEDYYNLDSKLPTPVLIGKAAELIEYLKRELQSKEKALLLVVNKGNGLNNPSTSTPTATTITANEDASSQNISSASNPPTTIGDLSVLNHISGIQGRKESADSGVVELLDRDIDLNIVDCNEEDEKYS